MALYDDNLLGILRQRLDPAFYYVVPSPYGTGIGIGIPCSEYFCRQWSLAEDRPINYFEYEYADHLEMAFYDTHIIVYTYETT